MTISGSELTLETARERLSYLAGVLDAVLDFVRDRADADCQGDPPRFVPNAWMQVQAMLEEGMRYVGMQPGATDGQ